MRGSTRNDELFPVALRNLEQRGCNVVAVGPVRRRDFRRLTRRTMGDPGGNRSRVLLLPDGGDAPDRWLPGSLSPYSPACRVIQYAKGHRDSVAAQVSTDGIGPDLPGIVEDGTENSLWIDDRYHGVYRVSDLDDGREAAIESIDELSEARPESDLRIAVGVLDDVLRNEGVREAQTLITEISEAVERRGGVAFYYRSEGPDAESELPFDELVDGIVQLRYGIDRGAVCLEQRWVLPRQGHVVPVEIVTPWTPVRDPYPADD